MSNFDINVDRRTDKRDRGTEKLTPMSQSGGQGDISCKV